MIITIFGKETPIQPDSNANERGNINEVTFTFILRVQYWEGRNGGLNLVHPENLHKQAILMALIAKFSIEMKEPSD